MSESAMISELQARNSELVSRLRIAERAANDRGAAVSAILYAYHRAIEKHQQFPAALDSQGDILAEEVLELTEEMVKAALAAIRAVNDHRDEAPNLAGVREEATHVGAVCLRILGKLDGVKA